MSVNFIFISKCQVLEAPLNSMQLLKKMSRNSKMKGRTERDREAFFDCQFASEARAYTERE